MVQIDVKIPARPGSVRANKTCVISLVNGGLKRLFLADVFAANVDVARMRIHRERRNQTTFDQGVRIMAHDLAILTGARLRFVCVHNKIRRTPIAFLWHERPLQSSRETSAATTAQATVLHLLNDPVAAVLDQLVGSIPMPPRLRALKRSVVHSIKVGKDPILVSKHAHLILVILAAAPDPDCNPKCPAKPGQSGKVKQGAGPIGPAQIRPRKIRADPKHTHARNDQRQTPACFVGWPLALPHNIPTFVNAPLFGLAFG